MTAKKVISRSSAEKNAVKYTLWRSKEDIEKIEKLKRYLNDKSSRSFNTDSQIYKELPDLYLNAVKKVSDHQLAIDELTAKLDQLEDLRTSFCRIFEICEAKK
jgi:ribosome-associated translation inhibitor RaiA